MRAFEFTADNEQDTERLGRVLAERLPTRTTVALDGPLGAGKTRLVQAVSAACGVDRRDVVSPTFVLAHHYQGRRAIYHLDAYRIKDCDEFADLGVEEYFASDGLVFVEWATRVAQSLPDERLEIKIDVTGPSSRRFTLRGHGDRMVRIVVEIRDALQQSRNDDGMQPGP